MTNMTSNFIKKFYRKIILAPYILVILYPSYFLANLSVQEFYDGNAVIVVLGTFVNIITFIVGPAVLILACSASLRYIRDTDYSGGGKDNSPEK